jgi:PPOX class probable F420-dependent enzyme
MSLPPAVAERIDGEQLSAFLATAADDRPHVAPVWYLSHEGDIWLFTSGQKLANIEANPRVSLAIEQTGEDGWLAICRGTATTVDDEELRGEIADRLFTKYMGGDGTEFRDESGEPTGTLVRVAVGSVDFREE